jgi:hypothetical protein
MSVAQSQPYKRDYGVSPFVFAIVMNTMIQSFSDPEDLITSETGIRMHT